MGGDWMCHKDANSNFMVVKLINFMNNIKVAYIVTNNYVELDKNQTQNKWTRQRTSEKELRGKAPTYLI